MIQDSEYLETHLVVVPKQLIKDFIKTYETISPFVVPRSAQEVASDDEFTLYTVTTFKKHSQEFIHKAREHRWTPRDFRFKEGGREEEQKEMDKVSKDERRVWGEALRLGRTAWGEAVMAWIHVLALRVFVESVLRYGLPLSFVCGLITVRTELPSRFALWWLTLCRPVPNSSRKQRLHWMSHTHTWAVTLSGVIRRVA